MSPIELLFYLIIVFLNLIFFNSVINIKIQKYKKNYQVSKYSIPYFLANPTASDFVTAVFEVLYKSIYFSRR